MEDFVAQKFDINTINGGKKYANGDGVSADTINKVIEAAFYAQEIERVNEEDFAEINGKIPLVVDETLKLPVTHESIVIGYKNSIDAPSLNKEPVVNEKFWGICKTIDNYIYSFVAKITGEINNGFYPFVFNEVMLLHDASFDIPSPLVPTIPIYVPRNYETILDNIKNYQLEDYIKDHDYAFWWKSAFNRKPIVDDLFHCVCSSLDGYVFSISAKIIQVSGNWAYFSIQDYENDQKTDFILYHNPQIDQNVMSSGLKFTTISENECEVRQLSLVGNKNVVIPLTYGDNMVTEIDTGGFAYSTTLQSIVLGDFIEIIGAQAFTHCTNLKKILWGKSVKKIVMGAFESCESLTSITIPNTVEEIEQLAFNGCNNLREVKIPISVKKIGTAAFYKINPEATIYCEVSGRPVGWDTEWNPDNVNVVWGAKF